LTSLQFHQKNSDSIFVHFSQPSVQSGWGCWTTTQSNEQFYNYKLCWLKTCPVKYKRNIVHRIGSRSVMAGTKNTVL
jgi:hypothetical protein